MFSWQSRTSFGILISIKATSRKQKRRYAICTAAFFIINISYNFVFRGRFCKFPRHFLVHQFWRELHIFQSRTSCMRCLDSVVAVVDADSYAHGKCPLSFQNLSGIYNKRQGRMCLPRRNFLRKSLRFCLSPLAVSAQKRTANGENSRCNKKAHPAFRQDARKIACGYFQANGINLVHFAPKSPVFGDFTS